jgi:hypothetical protein
MLKIIKFRIQTITILFIGHFFLFSCAVTFEFIPEAEINSRSFIYLKQSPKEVEVLFQKPNTPTKTMGIVIIRSFTNENEFDKLKKEIQQELYERKIDGVYFSGKMEWSPGSPFVIRAENQTGAIVSLAEAEQEIGKITGIAYRYINNGNKPKNLRQ